MSVPHVCKLSHVCAHVRRALMYAALISVLSYIVVCSHLRVSFRENVVPTADGQHPTVRVQGQPNQSWDVLIIRVKSIMGCLGPRKNAQHHERLMKYGKTLLLCQASQ